jgi:FkbM family methyltransferase
MKQIDYQFLNGKDVGQVIAYADDLAKKSIEDKLNAHQIYTSLIEINQVPNLYEHPYAWVRGGLRQKIFDLEKFFNWNMFYSSQSGQDKFINSFIFKNIKNGFFVEIGAYDGVMGSNCLFFERYLGWDGIAVEPSPSQFNLLKNNRKCRCINKAISNKKEVIEFVDVIEGKTQMSGINKDFYSSTLEYLNKDQRTKFNKINIETSTFSEVLADTFHIDYLSIDVEGYEKDILESIDFNKYKVKVLSVENNKPKDINLNSILFKYGFMYLDNVGNDEIYIHKKNFQSQ